MHEFQKLRVWDRAMDLTKNIYVLTRDFPKHELYGLSQQLRRAAVSIPSNIAEGAYRNSNKEFNHFLGIAGGSAGEVYTQMEIAKRLGYVQEELATPILDDADAIKRMIFKLQQQL
ncbi:MAG: four helix bundle protein [Bacteroidota bacterium]